jgi:glycosyl transferase family 25
MVINLDRDASRLEHMRRQLGAVGLPFARFAAIDGRCVPEELRGYFDGSDASLTAGEIGCYASHLALCRLVANGDVPAPLLVLEDDVEVIPDLPHLLQRLIAALPADWDIVRLSYPTKRASVRIAQLMTVFELVRYSQVPTSTGAYLLSRSGARRFLAQRKRALPVDHDLRRVWAWGLDTYGVSPPPVHNDRVAGSSIDAMAPGARGDKRRASRLRRKRWLEGPLRQARGMSDFGCLQWLGLETVNLIGRVLPRAERRMLFAWASVALAPRATRAAPTA